ncbi:MAG: hypothetical protein J5614_09735 [Paludibacteraceae bacterium]|nr:hypothetical protein [Paludibacteraceae bacterium]
MKRLTDIAIEDELRIAEETEAVDRVFKEVGFEPVKIPDFDPDDVITISGTGHPLNLSKCLERQRIARRKEREEEERLWAIQMEEERKKREAEEAAMKKAMEELRKKEEEKRKKEEAARKRRIKQNQEKATKCVQQISELRDKLNKAEEAGAFDEADSVLEQIISLRMKQFDYLEKECDFEYKFSYENDCDRHIVCDKFGIERDQNDNIILDFSTYILYNEFSSMDSDNAVFKMFTLKLSKNILSVCIAFNDIVYAPAEIVFGRDGSMALHEELTVYQEFQNALLIREPDASIIEISKWISKVMHTIVENQPGFAADKFICVKHKRGLETTDIRLNKCSDRVCKTCPYYRYCSTVKNYFRPMEKARYHIYKK